ncbi:MAG: class I SAM-dependent methyltransferase [Bdellovibrionota bacterium]
MNAAQQMKVAQQLKGAPHLEGGADQEFLESAPCALCGASSFRVIRKAEYPKDLDLNALLKVYCSSSDHKLMDQLVECNQCKLVYLAPRVKKEIALRSYSDAIDPTFVQQNHFRINTFKRALRKFCNTVNIVPKPSLRVLDVGCAGGAFVKAASDAGFTAIGVEPSKWMVEHGKKEYGLDLRAGLLEDQGFEPESFDIVTLWDVVEHLYNPTEVLNECKKVLKPGGYLIVNYPDYGSLARRTLGWKWPFFLSVHLFYFTPRTIRMLIEKLGFSVVKISPFFQTLELAYVCKRAAPYIPPAGWAGSLLKAVGLGKVPFTYNVGQTMVIAKKDERKK